MSRSSRWEIVDFEGANASVVEVRRDSLNSSATTVQTIARTTLSQKQVSEAIYIANQIWRRGWAGLEHQNPPRPAPMCTDIVNELILLDSDRTLASHSTCPFSEDKKQGWNIAEANLDDWFNALFPQAPMPPSTPN